MFALWSAALSHTTALCIFSLVQAVASNFYTIYFFKNSQLNFCCRFPFRDGVLFTGSQTEFETLFLTNFLGFIFFFLSSSRE